tara:strand:+ start:378 stop:1202 length:825 start_codon:yes stop_codon:yes gene_type:complete
LNKILEVENLSYSWGTNEVFRNINFTVENNKVIAILGKNGVGKTTLLKCINRILKPISGSVRIDSKDISSLDLVELSKMVSYVPQSIMSNFPMEVFDVVLLGRRPHINWTIGDTDREKVSETLRFFNLQDFAFRNFNQLSGGERQRVIVAKAVSQDSSIFLMDEPTSDLDLKNQIEIMKKIKHLVSDSGNGKAAIIAIHDINIAARFADSIFLLDKGEIRAKGTPEEVLTEKNIEQVFGVTSEVIPKTRKDPMRILIKDELNDKQKVVKKNDKE